MNERIKELAKQARIQYEQGGAKIQDPGQYYHEDVVSKFALLIIRECARIAIEKQTKNDILNIVSENPAKDFAYALVEHFGVEK